MRQLGGGGGENLQTLDNGHSALCGLRPASRGAQRAGRAEVRGLLSPASPLSRLGGEGENGDPPGL